MSRTERGMEAVANGRARYAFESIKKLFEGAKEKKKKEYRSLIKKMPMMIKVNGFAQSLAFYYSKGDEHKEILRILQRWFSEQTPHLPFRMEGEKEEDFVMAVIQLDSNHYRLATMEAIDLLTWMGRFAEGMVKSEEKRGEKQ